MRDIFDDGKGLGVCGVDCFKGIGGLAIEIGKSIGETTEDFGTLWLYLEI